jgi:hypothetical protein
MQVSFSSTLTPNPPIKFQNAHVESTIQEIPKSFFANFNNPNIPKDFFLEKFKSDFLDERYFLQVQWTIKPLPKLREKELINLVNFLACERIMRGRNNSFEIKFTLAELFNYFLQNKKHTTWIENIELIGSAIPWILNDYLFIALTEFGVKNPEEWLVPELMREFAAMPGDFDFRLYLPKATTADIIVLRDTILEFIVEKQMIEDPKLNKKYFQNLVRQTGFSNFTQPKNLEKNIMSVVGFTDEISGQGVDIVFYQKLSRHSLFIQDALKIDLKPLVLALGNQSSEELITQIKSRNFNFVMIPTSDYQNGAQALFDRLAGIVRANNISSIDSNGWPVLLTCYLKGKRCLTPELEELLLEKLCRTFDDFNTTADLPQALHQELVLLPASVTLPEKIATVAAFWLKKSMLNHIEKNATAALVYTLQACLSLKKHGYETVLEHLWKLINKNAHLMPESDFSKLIYETMNCGLGALESLISLLEVKAFLQLNTAFEKQGDDSFKVALIKHQEGAAIQFFIDGFPLLLPFNPMISMLNLKTALEKNVVNNNHSLQISLEKIYSFLQLKVPYIKDPESMIGRCFSYLQLENFKVEFRDFASLYEKISIEWLLACEKQQGTSSGSKQIENCMLTLLNQENEKCQRERLLKSAQNQNNSPQQTLLYDKVLFLDSSKDYVNVPMPLKWAMALTTLKDESQCLVAYSLWKEFFFSLDFKFKIAFNKVFMRHLSLTRADLAAEIIEKLSNEELSFTEMSQLFITFMENYKKQPRLHTKKSLSQLANTFENLEEKRNQANQELTPIHIEAFDLLFLELIDQKQIDLVFKQSLLLIEKLCTKEKWYRNVQFLEKWVEALKNGNYLQEAETAWLKIYKTTQHFHPYLFNSVVEVLQKIAEKTKIVEKIVTNKTSFASQEEYVHLSMTFITFLKPSPLLWKNALRELFDYLLLKPSTLLNIQNALGLLKTLPFVNANSWKELFQSIQDKRGKDLSLEAWNFFFPSLENPNRLTGTLSEIAEAWHWAIKTIMDWHPSCLLDFIGNESLLLRIFDHPVTQESKMTTLNLYFEGLTEGCLKENQTEHLHKLLESRLAFGEEMKAPIGESIEFKQIDASLAKSFSSAPQVFFQIKAFQIFISLGSRTEAETLLEPLIQYAIPEEEQLSLLKPILIFFSKLSKEQLPLALKILQQPFFGSILKHDPENSLKVLYNWYIKLLALDESLLVDIEWPILKQAFPLVPLATESLIINRFAEIIIDFLQKTTSLLIKRNLKNLLSANQAKFAAALENQENYYYLFRLVTELLNYKFNFNKEPQSVDIYYKLYVHLIRDPKNLTILELYEHFERFQTHLKNTFNSPYEKFAFSELINKLMAEEIEEKALILIKAFFHKVKKEDFVSAEELYNNCLNWAIQLHRKSNPYCQEILCNLVKENSSHPRFKYAINNLMEVLSSTSYPYEQRLSIFIEHYLLIKTHLESYIELYRLERIILDFVKSIETEKISIKNLKDLFPLLVDCEKIPSELSVVLLSETAKFEDQELAIMSWHFFWNVLLAKNLLVDAPLDLTKSWQIILQIIYLSYTEAYLYIFNRLERFTEFLDLCLPKEQLESIHLLLTGAVHRPIDKVSLLRSWLATREKLQIYFDSNSYFQEDIEKIKRDVNKAKVALFIIAGDETQFDSGCSELSEVLLLNDDINQFITTSHWLLLIFSHTSSCRITKVCEIYLPLFISKTNAFLEKCIEIPYPINFFYKNLYEHFLAPQAILKLAQTFFKTATCPLSFELGTVIVYIALNDKNLSENEINSFSECLDEVLERLVKNNTTLSTIFFYKITQDPLSNRLNKKLTPLILYNLILLGRQCLSRFKREVEYFMHSELVNEIQIESVNEIQNSIALMKLANIYLPHFFKDEAKREAIIGLILDTLLEVFEIKIEMKEDLYDYFIAKIVEQFNNGFEKRKANELIYNFHSKFVDKILRIQHIYHSKLRLFGMILKKQFLLLMNFSNLDAERLRAQIETYIYTKISDPLYIANEPILDILKNNDKEIFFHTNIKQIFKDKPEVLFEYLCLFHIPPKQFCIELKQTEAEEIMLKIIDYFASWCSLYGIYLIPFLLKLDVATFNVTPKVHVHCWQALLELTSNMNVKMEGDISLFEGVIASITQINDFNQLVKKNKSLEWQIAASEVCKLAFVKLCNPSNAINPNESQASSLEIIEKASRFLTKALQSHCFAGQPTAYFELIEHLIDNHTFQEWDSLINILILQGNTWPDKRAQAMSRWIEKLAAKDLTTAKKALKIAVDKKIYHNFDGALQEFISINTFINKSINL